MNFYKKNLGLIIALVLVLAAVTAGMLIVSKKQTGTRNEKEIADFNHEDKTIGVVEGLIFDTTVQNVLPRAKVKYYDSRESVYKGLIAGEVDAVAEDDTNIRSTLRSTDEIKMIDGYLEESEYAFVFPKDAEGKALSEEFSAYVTKQRNLGELEKLDEKWFGRKTDNKKSEDLPTAQDGKKTLTLAFYDEDIPFSYYSAGKTVGYDIDVAIGFCRANGYGLTVEGMKFQDMLTAVSEGKYDFGCGSVTVTEERAERLIFSAPDYEGGVKLCVAAVAKSRSSRGFVRRFADSFSEAFLTEGRGLLFLGGVLTTILVTLLAVAIGTPIGMIAYAASRRGHLITRMLTKLLAELIQGVPALMIIMSLYFAFYSNMRLGGVIAGVIGFALSFGNEFYGNLSYHAKQCKDGKTEEDYRLYAIEGDTFFKTLFEEEGKGISFGYRESILHLLKMTAVLGFVAVQDMTKVMEIIRMESYEQAMILTVTTITYFIIIKLIAFFFSKVSFSCKPEKKDN